MPRLSAATGVLRPELMTLMTEFVEVQEDFIATKVFPIFQTDEKEADFPFLPVEALLDMPSTIRAPRSNYPRGDYEFKADNFSCVEHGWEEPVDEVEARLYAKFFDAEEVAARRATGIILRNQEKRVADMLFNEGNFTVHNVTKSWNDKADSTPIEDVNAGKQAIHDALGVRANCLVLTYPAVLALSVCEEIIDRVQSDITVEGELDAKALAKIFLVDQILVAGGRYNTANAGQDAVLGDIWSSAYAMLCRISSDRDLRVPQIGRTFLWTGDSPENIIVESYEEKQKRSMIIRCRQHTDENILNEVAGYLLGNIIP
jgi:hypothetical protein